MNLAPGVCFVCQVSALFQITDTQHTYYRSLLRHTTMSHQQDGSTGIDESDLAPSHTAGYRVGEQKTIDELQNLDKDDEALNRWKQSLLGGAAAGPGAAAGGKPVVSAYTVLGVVNPIEKGGRITRQQVFMVY